MLNVTVVDGVLPVQEAEASQTLFELTKAPKKCFRHIRRYSTAVILASVFGQRVVNYEDPKRAGAAHQNSCSWGYTSCGRFSILIVHT